MTLMVVNDDRSTINAKEKRLITDSPIKKNITAQYLQKELT